MKSAATGSETMRVSAELVAGEGDASGKAAPLPQAARVRRTRASENARFIFCASYPFSTV